MRIIYVRHGFLDVADHDMIMMLDQQQINDTLRKVFPAGATISHITPLAGDASNRRYFRVQFSEGLVPSLILMQLAAPEQFKESEEAVSGVVGGNHELPFINILNYLREIGVDVPTLYHFDDRQGLLYLEDFGDETLWDHAQRRGAPDAWWYGKAIDQLAEMHLEALKRKNPVCLAFHRSFDAGLFVWEFDHFLEYGVEARSGEIMSSTHAAMARNVFHEMAQFLAAQPTVLTHRDYHSRNLMVHGRQLGVIDFQDALLGPVTYDVASLLRDSYVTLDEVLIDELLDRFVTGMSRGLDGETRERMLLTDQVAFRRLFDFTCIQRNLKAAGRFVYIDRVKGNPKFLPDIPRTLAAVRRNLEGYSELYPLYAALRPYVPEWQ